MSWPALTPTGRGIALMCGAVTILPVMDAVSKSRTGDYSPVQIAAVRFGCLLLLGPVTLRHSGRAALNPPGRGMLFLRGLLLSTSSILFVSALAQVPLAMAQSIVLVFPPIVTAVSPLLLGEQVRPVRKAAVAVGFGGALLIIRPGLEPVGAGPASRWSRAPASWSRCARRPRRSCGAAGGRDQAPFDGLPGQAGIRFRS